MRFPIPQSPTEIFKAPSVFEILGTFCKDYELVNIEPIDIPVHMHERLSASTDLRPVRPEVARDKSGVGSVRTGISGGRFSTLCRCSESNGLE
jgi:hypothetical protein